MTHVSGRGNTRRLQRVGSLLKCVNGAAMLGRAREPNKHVSKQGLWFFWITKHYNTFLNRLCGRREFSPLVTTKI